jgi:tetratricopeptide (TPR) repeat protein
MTERPIPEIRDLTIGLQLQKAGRFAEAARCYHSVLERKPDNADALHLLGVLLHQNGSFDAAIRMIGRAVAVRPGEAAYHANLALAYRARGELQQAVDCCRTALRLQPDFAEAANNLGLAFHDLGRFADAVAQYDAALKMRPGLAVLHDNRGASLLELDLVREAESAYRTAIRLDPTLAEAQGNLGQLLVDRGQAGEGLTHCQEAVRLAPQGPALLIHLGNAYRALHRPNEARAAYDKALSLACREPVKKGEAAQVNENRAVSLLLEGKTDEAGEGCRGVLPGAHFFDELLKQGCLREELGDMADAEALYRRARAIRPDAPDPLGHLALLLGDKLPQADRDAIEAFVARRSPEPRGSGPSAVSSDVPAPGALAPLAPNAPMRGPLLFGLAQVLDAGGSYLRAAECLAEANALAGQKRRRAGRHYDPFDHSALVDRISEGFVPGLFERLSGAGDQTRLPIFVFGLPRSGTTLVEQVLASHSRVHGAGELALANELVESIPQVLGRTDDGLNGGLASCLGSLDAAGVRELARGYLDGLKGTLKGVALPPDREVPPDRIVDKMPDNYLHLGILAVLFPQATFISVRRDVRDVALSCWMTNFRSVRWADDQENIAARCRDYRRLMDHWQTVLPVRVHELAYERLVDDFDTEAPRLLAACALDWDESCRQFHQTSRPVRTSSVVQVRQPLYRKAVQRWKRYERPLAGLFERLPVDQR